MSYINGQYCEEDEQDFEEFQSAVITARREDSRHSAYLAQLERERDAIEEGKKLGLTWQESLIRKGLVWDS